MAVFSKWSNYQLYGWALDSVEEFREYVNSQGLNFDRQVRSYKDSVYDSKLAPLFDGGGVKFNLGGDNDKSKLEFTDRPIGVFDFSVAAQQLFRVHEFFSEQLKIEKPDLFQSYNVPAGVVPNYFVKRITIQGVNNFVYEDDGKEYICIRRQKGLTKLLEEQPNLKTKIQEGTGLIIPELPTNKVKFASSTKKPYLKYKKQGGKVRYVEMYSAHYYTRMSGDFQYGVRHIPMIMAAEYLEKMGTLTKLYVTRFVIPSEGNPSPKRKDVQTGIELPLWTEWQKFNEPKSRYLIMPMCLKEYGQEINKPAFFMVSSQSYQDSYKMAAQNMNYHEVARGKVYPYGNPNWTEKEYQEGFERFRQKYYKYAEKGIWKAKEIVPQGLIYFHDLVLNMKFDTFSGQIKNIFNEAIEKLILSNPSVNKWFEIWMRISALTIKDKFDIFNTNKAVMVYKDIIKQQENILQEIELLIRLEKNTDFAGVLKQFLSMVKTSTSYDSSGFLTSLGYSYGNAKKYITEKIDEMTIFAQDGIFATPDEQVEKRTEIAERLYEELTKI
jgi:hypothetical protein